MYKVSFLGNGKENVNEKHYWSRMLRTVYHSRLDFTDLPLIGMSVTGITLVENELVHWFLIIPVTRLVLGRLPQGWKTHKDIKPVLFGISGMGLLFMCQGTITKTKTIFQPENRRWARKRGVSYGCTWGI